MKCTALILTTLLASSTVFAQAKKAPAKTAPAKPAAAPGTKEWAAAQRLYQAQNYKQAAVSFFRISRKSPDIKLKRRAKFYLGVSLYKMNLKQVASFAFVDLVRTGEGVEKAKGLDYLVAIADELGEPSLLNYALNHIRPEELSDTSKAVFLGRLGEAALSKGDTIKAQSYFEKALEFKRSENSLIYNLALSQLIAKQPGPAATNFIKLVERLDNKPITDLEKGLAIMGQARAFYQGKKWKEAAEIYRQIPKDHPLYRQSLMELSWSLFRSGQFRSALSPLRTLHTPFYENFYDPESLLLHGTILLFICHYDEIEPISRSFDDNYYPAFAKIQEWLNSPRTEADYYLEIAKTRRALVELRSKGETKIETILPFFVMRTLLEEPDLRLSVTYLDQLAKEKKILDKIYAKTSLHSYGKQILDGRKKSVSKLLGGGIRDRLAAKVLEFNEFATQFEFLKYETINGQRTALKKKIAANQPETEQIDKDVTRDYYVQNGFRFWPFEGEYWRDEIGNYQYVGVNRCE
ncbi:MAG: tetratricopeptide repeat protein [Pseudobdellovibrionaceae bacterium]